MGLFRDFLVCKSYDWPFYLPISIVIFLLVSHFVFFQDSFDFLNAIKIYLLDFSYINDN